MIGGGDLFARHWRIGVQIACVCLVLTALTLRAAEYHGRVRYGSVPVPGATVTLTQGSTELTTVTDSQGLYEFPSVAEGGWKISIVLRGFAPMRGSVTIGATNEQGEWTLQMLELKDLLSMAQTEPATTSPLKARDKDQSKQSTKSDKPRSRRRNRLSRVMMRNARRMVC